jgi:acetyl-CoA carboxylase biotin carboxyl carrier protein
VICGVERDGAVIRVRSPGVGVWRGGPRPGHVVVGDQVVGSLEVLGRLVELRLPAGIGGRVVDSAAGSLREVGVDFGAELLVLDAEVAAGVADAPAVGEATSAAALVFRAPTSGRFYSRPGPDKPPFVSPGDAIAAGDTVCMLEVMKTFSRVAYAGDPARVVAIIPADGDDLDAGDVVLELEPR